MALNTDFNVEPYYDDYDEEKNFHRILFRPAVPIQARELTQLQTILQNQVERFGDNIYRQGTIIKGCSLNFDYDYTYVKINDLQLDGQPVVVSLYNNAYVKDSSNLTSRIVNYYQGLESQNPDLSTLFLKYINTGYVEGQAKKKYANGDVLTVHASNYSIQNITIASQGSTYSNSDVIVFSGGGGTGAAANIVTFPSNGSIKDVVITNPGSGYITAPTISITTGTGSAGSLTALNYIAQVKVANSSFAAPVGVGAAVTVSDGIVYQKGHFVRVEEQTTIASKYTNQPSNVALGFVTYESVVNTSVDSTTLDNAQGYSNFTAPGAHRLKLTSNLVAISIAEAEANNEFFSILEFQNGIVTKRRVGTEFNSVASELAKRTREESGNYVVKPFSIYTEEIVGNTSHLNLSVSSGIGYVDGFRVELPGIVRVPIRKGTNTVTSTNQDISTNYGNYIVVTELLGNFNFSTGTRVNLRNTAATDVTDNFGGAPSATTGTIIGTAVVKSLMYDSGTPGTSECRYRLYLYEIIMEPGEKFSSVMSVQTSGGVADVVLDDGKAVLQETDFDTLIFTSGANAVSYFDDEQFIYRKVGSTSLLASGIGSVQLTGSEEFPYTISSTLNNTQEQDFIVVPTTNSHSTTNLSGTVTTTGNSVAGLNTQFINELDVGDYVKFAGNNSLYRVSTITSATAMKIAGTTGPGLSGVNYSWAFPKNVPIRLNRGTANISIDSLGNTAAIYVGNTINQATDATVYFNSKVDGASPKPKTVVKNVYVKLSTAKLTDTNVGPWCLGIPDVFKIVGVYVGSGTTYLNTTTNYASSFELISGQTNNKYGLSYIRKKPGSSLSLTGTNNLLVKVNCFTHGTGYYLSTESYPVDDSTTPLPANKIRTEDIPYYRSPKDNKYFNLRDCIDFRPIEASTAAISTTVDGATIDPVSTSTLTGTLYYPTPNESFEADITYYLKRADTIVIDVYGKVSVVEGSPDKTPVPPRATDGTMTLGYVNIPPYPSLSPRSASKAQRNEYSTLIQTDQVKGYSMKDIKQMEERINRLEYYSLLNTLEKSTTDLVIPSESNLSVNRFKNGFFAESFSSYDISNVNDPEYSIHIDTTTSIARPQAEKTTIRLVANTTGSSNVTFKGEYALLDYDEKVFLNQRIANKTRNPTQLLWKFWGSCELFPKYDDYYDSKSGQVNVTIDLAQPLNALTKAINDNVTFKNDATQITAVKYGSYNTVTAPTVASTGLDERVVTTTVKTTTNQLQLGDTNLNKQDVGEFVTNFGLKPYIRAQGLTFVASGLRPGTRHYVFFDKVNVSNFCRPAQVENIETMDPRGLDFEDTATFTGLTGTPLMTDEKGVLVGVFYIPSETFFTGDRQLYISDSDNLDGGDSSVSYATSTYSAYSFFKDSSKLSITTKAPTTVTNNPTVDVDDVRSTEQRITPRLQPPAPVGCFIAGTKITLADGSVKNVEDVKVGDKLIGKDNSINQVLEYVRPLLGDRTLISLNGGTPFMTNDHPVYMKDGTWKSFNPDATKKKYKKLSDSNVGRLEVGDVIETVDGVGFEITSLSEHEDREDLQVYNFSLDGNHTYTASGLIVHNKCFVAGTEVLLKGGAWKNIEDVDLSDVLVGENGLENNIREFHRPVLGLNDHLLPHKLRLASINGSDFAVSEDHMIKTTSGWKTPTVEMCKILHAETLKNENIEITQLTIGDDIICSDGSLITVESVEFKEDSSELQLYNFKLHGNKTYHVRMKGTDKFILVHNKDPLAQTFAINNNDGSDGVYLTKIDLYFKQKDPELGATVQIRETINGYPSANIIARRTLENSSINVSDTAAIATVVNFNTPVYLKNNVDYCVVVIPDQYSPEFLLWVGETGRPDVTDTSLVSNMNWGEGVMFLSTNDKTWTPYQGEDLKFTAYIASFNKTSGTVLLENDDYEFITLSNPSGSFSEAEEVAQKSDTYLSGTFTCNVSSLLVNCTSSQVPSVAAGDYVLIVYANDPVTKTGTVSAGTTLPQVTGVGTAFVSEYDPGDYLLINGEVREVVSITNNLSLTLDAPLKTAVTDSVHKGVSNKLQVSRVREVTSTQIKLKNKPSYKIDGGVTNYGAIQKVVRGVVDVVGNDDTLIIRHSTASSPTFLFQSGKKIVGETSQATATISSVDDRLVNFTESHLRYIAPPTTNVTLTQKIDGVTATAANSTVREGISNPVNYEAEIKSKSNEISSGSKSFKLYADLKTDGSFTSISPVLDTVPASVVVLQNIINNDYTNETTRYGNSKVRYISKNVILADGLDAEDIKVYITAYKPSASDILVYGKIISNDDSETFESKDWTLLQQVTESNLYSDSLNESDFIEYEYGFKLTPPSTTLAGVVTSSSNTTITGTGTSFDTDLATKDIIKVVNTNTLTDYDIAVVDAVTNATHMTVKSNTSFTSITSKVEKVTSPLAAFKYNQDSNIVTYFDSARGKHSTYKNFAIKVVLVSSSTKYVPILRDLRAIAVSI